MALDAQNHPRTLGSLKMHTARIFGTYREQVATWLRGGDRTYLNSNSGEAENEIDEEVEGDIYLVKRKNQPRTDREWNKWRRGGLAGR